MSINMYYLASSFIKLLLHNVSSIGLKAFYGILGFSGMGIYLAGVAYLVIRKNKKATHLLALTTAENQQAGDDETFVTSLPREDIVNMQLPQRRSAIGIE